MQHQGFGGAIGHQFAARVAALGPEINQPVGGADDVQVVLDHQQRVARVLQLAQRPHEFGNVVKVQTRGGFIQHEQDATARQSLAAGAAALGRIGQKTCQLQALCLTTTECGHGLAQFDVVQTHVHNRLQGARHLAVLGK